MYAQLTGPERVAVMVKYLRRDVAQRILGNLDSDEIREIGAAIQRIGHVPPETVAEVVRMFVNDLGGPSRPARPAPPPPAARGDADFADFIAEQAPQAVAAILLEELPQSRAVALVLMGTANARRILALMSPSDQRAAAGRMAQIRHLPAEIAEDVVQGIRAGLEHAAGDPDEDDGFLVDDWA